MELLSGTAHLQRGGRNPTEGAKNRARSLTDARYFNNENYFFCICQKKIVILHAKFIQ